jgi:hypothetical protein
MIVPSSIPTPKPITASSDKKAKANLKTTKILKDETNLRLQE